MRDRVGIVGNCCTAICRLPGQPSLFAILTCAFFSAGLRRIMECVRSSKVVRSWSAVILAPVSQSADAHVCLWFAVAQQCLPYVCVGLPRVLAYHDECSRCGTRCVQGQGVPNFVHHREGGAGNQPDRSLAPLVVCTCVSRRGCRFGAAGDGEAAQKKFKEGEELAVRALKRGPEVEQSYTLAVLLTKKVGETLPLKLRIADLFKVNSWAMKAAELDEGGAMAQHPIGVPYFDVTDFSSIQRKATTAYQEKNLTCSSRTISTTLGGDTYVHMRRNDEANKWCHYMLDRTLVTAKKQQVHDVVKMKYNEMRWGLLLQSL